MLVSMSWSLAILNNLELFPCWGLFHSQLLPSSLGELNALGNLLLSYISTLCQMVRHHGALGTLVWPHLPPGCGKGKGQRGPIHHSALGDPLLGSIGELGAFVELWLSSLGALGLLVRHHGRGTPLGDPCGGGLPGPPPDVGPGIEAVRLSLSTPVRCVANA